MTLQSSHSVLCLLGVTSGKAMSRCPDPTWMHWQNGEPLTDECHYSSIGVGFRVSSAKCILADAKPVTVSLTKQMVEVIKTTSHGSSSYDFEQDFFQLDFWSQSWTSQHSPLAAHLGWIDGTPGTPLSAHLFRESSCCPVWVPRSCCGRVVLKRTAPCGPLCRMAAPGFRRWWPAPSRGAESACEQPASERGSSVQHHPAFYEQSYPIPIFPQEIHTLHSQAACVALIRDILISGSDPRSHVDQCVQNDCKFQKNAAWKMSGEMLVHKNQPTSCKQRLLCRN